MISHLPIYSLKMPLIFIKSSRMSVIHTTPLIIQDSRNGTHLGEYRCDEYFYLPHRKETRGVGGIFFDDLESENMNDIFKFVEGCGLALVDQYVPIVKKRMNTEYTQAQKDWQQLRRGRYVEFNLVS